MGKICYPWVMIGEFEDGYSYEMPGNDIGDCLARLEKLESKHGDLIWYGGLNDEDYVDGEYIGQENKLMSSRRIQGARSISWNDLSGADQMAVEYANMYIEQGEDLEGAASHGCNTVSEGNAEAEYEGEAFYMEEPDYTNVYNYLFSIYSSSKISSSDDVRTFQNKRNPNKYLESKKYKDGHTVSRQYMKWDTDRGEVKNYMGSKSNRGRWHRMNQRTLNDVVQDDYDEITSARVDVNLGWIRNFLTELISDIKNGDVDTFYSLNDLKNYLEDELIVSDYWWSTMPKSLAYLIQEDEDSARKMIYDVAERRWPSFEKLTDQY